MTHDPHAPAAGPPGPGYAGVALRISRLTINIFATAVVLILLLLLGQNLGDLWRSSTTNPAMGLPQTSTTVPHDGAATIEFGEGELVLMQSQVAGDAAAVVKELRRVCRAAAAGAESDPGDPPGIAELRLLRMLTPETPVEQLDPQTEVFLLSGAIPLAVVTKNGVLAADAGGSAEGKVASLRRRVVVWGIAIPRGTNAWTVYAFHPQKGAENVAGSIPLPPNTEPILSVRKQGESVRAFRGAQEIQVGAWRTYYDRWAAENGLRTEAGWSETHGTWSRHFTRSDGKRQEQVDIQFGPDGQGGLRGLITTSTDAATGG